MRVWVGWWVGGGWGGCVVREGGPGSEVECFSKHEKLIMWRRGGWWGLGKGLPIVCKGRCDWVSRPGVV